MQDDSHDMQTPIFSGKESECFNLLTTSMRVQCFKR